MKDRKYCEVAKGDQLALHPLASRGQKVGGIP